MVEPPERQKDENEETREIWRKLAEATKSSPEDIETELPKAEDLVEGPLPEEPEVTEERMKKLEAARLAEEARRAEEAKRLEEIRKAEEEARKAEEELKKAEDEAIKIPTEPVVTESTKESIGEPQKAEEPAPPPESANLLLVGLVNLLQPALDIKMESKKYQRWIKGWDKVIEVSIINEGKVHVVIKDNQMKAAVGPAPREPDIVIEGEYETITNYLNGELDPILMFFDFILLRKARLVKGLDIKLSNILSGNIFQQARDLYRIDKILKIK